MKKAIYVLFLTFFATIFFKASMPTSTLIPYVNNLHSIMKVYYYGTTILGLGVIGILALIRVAISKDAGLKAKVKAGSDQAREWIVKMKTPLFLVYRILFYSATITVGIFIGDISLFVPMALDAITSLKAQSQVNAIIGEVK